MLQVTPTYPLTPTTLPFLTPHPPPKSPKSSQKDSEIKNASSHPLALLRLSSEMLLPMEMLELLSREMLELSVSGFRIAWTGLGGVGRRMW